MTNYIKKTHSSLQGREASVFVETAGGVHSPALHLPHTQSTFLRPLLLPSILIGSPQLGGISTTVSAYESLLIRGYSISAVLCLEDGYYRNHEFLADYFAERGIKFYSISQPPKKEGTVEEDGQRLGEWYDRIHSDGTVGECAEWLDEEHKARIERLEGMPDRTLSQVWWPFTQHGIVSKKEDVMVIDSAHGDCFDAYYAKPSAKEEESKLNAFFDGSASWFTYVPSLPLQLRWTVLTLGNHTDTLLSH